MSDRRTAMSRTPRSIAVFTAAGAAIVFAFYLAVLADPDQHRDLEQPFAAESEDEQAEGEARNYVSAEEADDVEYQTPQDWEGTDFAESLEGTEIDGFLRADGDGRLIVELAVRDLFDYFLNTAEDVGPEAAIERIERLAESYLPESAAAEALVLLDQYLEYKERAIEVGNQPLATPDQQSPEYQVQMLEQGLEQLKQARREVFSDTAVTAFFGKEEAYADYTLARMQIEQREDLSREEKDQKIRLQQEQLPEVVRRSEERAFEAQQQQREIARVMEEAESAQDAESELRGLGLPEDRVQMISQRVSERQAFDEQYAAYREQKRALDEAGYASSDREQRLEALREEYFEDESNRSRAAIRDSEGSFQLNESDR